MKKIITACIFTVTFFLSACNGGNGASGCAGGDGGGIGGGNGGSSCTTIHHEPSQQEPIIVSNTQNEYQILPLKITVQSGATHEIFEKQIEFRYKGNIEVLENCTGKSRCTNSIVIAAGTWFQTYFSGQDQYGNELYYYDYTRYTLEASQHALYFVDNTSTAFVSETRINHYGDYISSLVEIYGPGRGSSWVMLEELSILTAFAGVVITNDGAESLSYSTD